MSAVTNQPELGDSRATDERGPDLLEVEGLTKLFPVRRGIFGRKVGDVHAVDGVNLTVDTARTVGLVGESGSGKSTVARLISRLIEPTSGTIQFEGEDLASLNQKEMLPARRRIQMVFQDPYSSFDPTKRLVESVAEPLKAHTTLNRSGRERRVHELFVRTGLSEEHASRYPSELSGGQLQRAAIARALTVETRLLLLDEPVSALDVSTQAQVINLLQDLQEELGLAYLFIAHDLSIVRHVSHRIAVMYLGRIVEEGAAEEIYDSPTHPYTEALLSAVPEPNPARQRARERIILSGDVPSPLNPPSGCSFRTRCPYAMAICEEVEPPAFRTQHGTTVHCHLHTTGPQLRGESVTVLRTHR